MPATDPININVHPLIYRWNSLLGQSQAAALEAAGKDGIIYNATYTNYWEGAMAWAGWWHNEVGLLTEVASVRVASPTVSLSDVCHHRYRRATNLVPQSKILCKSTICSHTINTKRRLVRSLPRFDLFESGKLCHL
jgi:hypothetical protein